MFGFASSWQINIISRKGPKIIKFEGLHKISVTFGVALGQSAGFPPFLHMALIVGKLSPHFSHRSTEKQRGLIFSHVSISRLFFSCINPLLIFNLLLCKLETRAEGWKYLVLCFAKKKSYKYFSLEVSNRFCNQVSVWTFEKFIPKVVHNLGTFFQKEMNWWLW